MVAKSLHQSVELVGTTYETLYYVRLDGINQLSTGAGFRKNQHIYTYENTHTTETKRKLCVVVSVKRTKTQHPHHYVVKF